VAIVSRARGDGANGDGGGLGEANVGIVDVLERGSAVGLLDQVVEELAGGDVLGDQVLEAKVDDIVVGEAVSAVDVVLVDTVESILGIGVRDGVLVRVVRLSLVGLVGVWHAGPNDILRNEVDIDGVIGGFLVVPDSLGVLDVGGVEENVLEVDTGQQLSDASTDASEGIDGGHVMSVDGVSLLLNGEVGDEGLDLILPVDWGEGGRITNLVG